VIRSSFFRHGEHLESRLYRFGDFVYSICHYVSLGISDDGRPFSSNAIILSGPRSSVDLIDCDLLRLVPNLRRMS